MSDILKHVSDEGNASKFIQISAYELIEFIDTTPASEISPEMLDEIHIAVIYKLRQIVSI